MSTYKCCTHEPYYRGPFLIHGRKKWTPAIPDSNVCTFFVCKSSVYIILLTFMSIAHVNMLALTNGHPNQESYPTFPRQRSNQEHIDEYRQ